MKLGNFSLSLSVKDLDTSIKFYQTLGFEVSGGNKEYKYVIMTNQATMIGLYEGFIGQNMMTFNPKWDKDCNQVEGADIREIHQKIKQAGINVLPLDNDSDEGINHFQVTDPDGNIILFDQHC